jgi:tungstate transport system permease protein
MLHATWTSWDDLREGVFGAFRLLGTGDAETWNVIRQSLLISVTATVLSLLVGLPLGTWLAQTRFRGRGVMLALCNTGFGVPPVVVGLVLSILLYRHGPLGWLGLRFTPTAMILAQFVLSVPIVIGLTAAAIQQLPPRLRLQMLALGASPGQLMWLLWREIRLPLLAAYMAALGRIISEVGASLMVGGDLQGSTRVLTTAVLAETNMGHYDRAIAYGVILLLLVLVIVGLLTWLQQREART